MSNTKGVQIEGRVPYNWTDNLGTDDMAYLGSLFLASEIGLSLSYVHDGYEPHGRGLLAMNRVCINGQEAVRLEVLVRIVEIINKAGTVSIAKFVDLDNPGPWGPIPTREQLEAIHRAAQARVEEMTRGRHWVTVGNTSHLEDD